MNKQANKNAQHRISALEKMLKNYNDAYYAGGPVAVSDATYDTLYRELVGLYLVHEIAAPESSVTKAVGHTRNSNLAKVQHEFPMLSLYTEVDYTIDGAREFHDRVTSILKENNITDLLEYVAEYKFDGMGVRLKYVSGILVQALTRGDGTVGEDVTANAMEIENIPKVFKDDVGIPFADGQAIWISGEVMITKEMLNKINEQRKAANKPIYANTRNLAAGTMRQGDVNVTRGRGPIFYPYHVHASDPSSLFDTHSENMAALRSLGFDQGGNELFDTTVKGADELYQLHMLVARTRDVLPFEIDGMVYKVNSLRLQDALGFTAREPRWAIAHKYPAQQVSTVVDAIDVQIGRTGKVTPMARFKPVIVGGVEVSNATLHSLHWMRKKGVHVGDTVIIQRAGDVVPELVMVTTTIPPWQDDTRVEWQMPSNCPLCNSVIMLSPDLKQAKCSGTDCCPGQTLNKLIHFCGRRAMNLVGIADKTLEALLEHEIIKDNTDLMCLKKEDFMKLPGVGAKSAIKMARSIAQGKSPSESRFLFALGIPTVGEVTAKDLLDHFGTLFDIRTAKEEELLMVKNVGPETAKQVYAWMNSSEGKGVLFSMPVRAGVLPRPHVKTSGYFNGLSFVVTGSFRFRDRQELETWIQYQGGKVTGSISKKTNYLVVGEGGGGKQDRAKELGVPIINEEELYALAKRKE